MNTSPPATLDQAAIDIARYLQQNAEARVAALFEAYHAAVKAELLALSNRIAKHG